MKKNPSKQTVRARIRGSVPDGKLRKARIVLSDAPARFLGGYTEYAKDRSEAVVKIAAPLGTDALSSCIVGHETTHATRHKPSRKKPATPQELLAAQFIDDANVEKRDLSYIQGNLLKYRRDHIAVALGDLRGILNDDRAIKAGKMKDDWHHQNKLLGHSLRCIAMLDFYGRRNAGETDGNGQPYSTSRVFNPARKGLLALRSVIGYNMQQALREIAALAANPAQRHRNRAISMLTALMEKMPELDGEEIEADPTDERPDVLLPPTSGTSEDGKVIYKDLRPKTVYCSRERSALVKHAPSGVIVNAMRYVAAIVSGDANGLFSRRVREKQGGTVVIDASGSMGTSAHNLGKLCAQVPTATVAYYSGTGRPAEGVFTIYAVDGKRYAGQLPEDTLYGNNNIDLPAVKWLFAHPKPWYFVSDLEFCGGTLGSEIVAKALIERAEKRGDLVVYRSLDAAYEAFGGKGDINS